MDETTQPLNLPDIPDVDHLLPSPGIPWWIWVIALALLGVGFFLFRIARKQKNSAEAIAELAYRQALAHLDKSRSLTTILEQSTAASLALRSYFAQALQDPSLYETHEEFMARHNSLSSLPEQTRAEIAQFFATLARFKYAPHDELTTKPSLIDDATEALHQWHKSARSATPSTP